MTTTTFPFASLRAAFYGLAAVLLAPAVWATPFTVNPDGTATDAATGLIWDRCYLGQSAVHCDASVTTIGHTWQAALQQVAALNARPGGYKGHGDWRLPNKNELESLVEIDSTAAHNLDATAFPDTAASNYWSSTAYARDPANAWFVNFDGDGGGVNFTSETYSLSVRMVRGGPSLAPFDALASYTITPSAGPHGALDPATPQAVPAGTQASFTVRPDAGYVVDGIAGCGGHLSGATYTTAPASADCTVMATFKAGSAAPTPVPTLGQWALALLAALTAALGLRRPSLRKP